MFILNKILLAVIVLSLLLVLVGFAADRLDFPFDSSLLIISATVMEWAAIVMLIVNGKTFYSRFRPWLLAGILVLMIGFFFRILHYAGAVEFFLFGILIVVVLYTIRFVLNTRDLLQWLKFLWVICVTLAAVLDMFHILHEDILLVLDLVPSLLLLAAVFVFYRKSVAGPRSV